MKGITELKLHRIKVFLLQPYYYIKIKYHLNKLYLLTKLKGK